MGNFERERQEIERLKRGAEQRNIEREEEKRRTETQIALRKRTYEVNLAIILKSAPDLLRRANEELFSGKGSISEWTEIVTPVHEHSGSDWIPIRDGGYTNDWSYKHLVRQLETRFQIPDLGAVVVFIPLQEYRGANLLLTTLLTKLKQKPIYNYRDWYCWISHSTKSAGFVCNRDDEALSLGLLDTSIPDSEKNVPMQLGALIGRAIVKLHKEYFPGPF